MQQICLLNMRVLHVGGAQARFLVIGMACSVQSAVIPKCQFREGLVSDVARAVGIPEQMVRVIKVTPRRYPGLPSSYAECSVLSHHLAPLSFPWFTFPHSDLFCFAVAVVASGFGYALLLKAVNLPSRTFAVLEIDAGWHKHRDAATEDKVNSALLLHLACGKQCSALTWRLGPPGR